MVLKCTGVAAMRRLACYSSVLILLAIIISASTTRAATAAFDLSGPKVAMTVHRGSKTLPISEVPNLQPGDRLWIQPELPADQSVHYLLVIAFLRGSTNPPPENWFTKVEVWGKQAREEGIVITVPQDAQQALLFFAPETGGDYSTLRSAVRSKPGVFVRASQDLNQASLDRSRLDKYLAGIKETSESNPQALHDRSALLARTLNMRLDQQCFDKPSEQQAPCLSQNTDQLVMDDGHSQSMVAALTSGPSSDLVGALSATSLAGGGFYSPYVGAVVDLARLMSSLHTAEYQYIPALALPQGDQLNLRLNNPPSFRKPKSVLVVGLPAVEAAQLPPLRAVNQDEVFCLQKRPLALPVDGAPLVFSRDIAHDFVLSVKNGSGAVMDLPATADAATGGFLVDARELKSNQLDSALSGTLHGYWGFEPVEGPTFLLRSAHPAKWTLPVADETALVVGREDTVHLQSVCAACVDQVTVEDTRGNHLKTNWKPAKPDELEVNVTLGNDTSGPVKILVKQSGLAKPDELDLRTYSEAAHLDRFKINAGDREGILKGTRLDQVESLQIGGVHFVPAILARAEEKDELHLAAPNGVPVALHPEQTLMADVTLKDGRSLELQTTVDMPRPKIKLLSKNIEPDSKSSAIRLGKQDELPQNGRISFLFKTEIPEQFARSEKVEVATIDGSFDAMLSVADGTLILQDAQTVLGVLDPAKTFGSSAFGALHFRVVDSDGRKGDWEPLANLVRLPSLKEIRCPDAPDKQCKLIGSDLFLIDSVASDPQFTHTAPVPIGFVDATLPVPRPNGTLLYMKLRDDPSTVNMMVLPVLPDTQ